MLKSIGNITQKRDVRNGRGCPQVHAFIADRCSNVFYLCELQRRRRLLKNEVGQMMQYVRGLTGSKDYVLARGVNGTRVIGQDGMRQSIFGIRVFAQCRPHNPGNVIHDGLHNCAPTRLVESLSHSPRTSATSNGPGGTMRCVMTVSVFQKLLFAFAAIFRMS